MAERESEWLIDNVCNLCGWSVVAVYCDGPQLVAKYPGVEVLAYCTNPCCAHHEPRDYNIATDADWLVPQAEYLRTRELEAQVGRPIPEKR